MYTGMHTVTCKQKHMTLVCTNIYIHNIHIYVSTLMIHTCTQTTLQYKYLAKQHKGAQLCSDGLTLRLRFNN